MTFTWEIVDTGTALPEKNMAIDANLLHELSQKIHPILHFYDWEGYCATYGHFIDPQQFLNPKGISSRKLHLARRPTGGGITFHVTDFAFSVLIPATHKYYSSNTIENYTFVNTQIIKALEPFVNNKNLSLLSTESESDLTSRHFCMARPTKYDIMLEGQKICGGAQRRTKQGFLHQGTITITPPSDEFLKDVLKPDTSVFSCIKKHAPSLFNNFLSVKELHELKREIRENLIQAFISD